MKNIHLLELPPTPDYYLSIPDVAKLLRVSNSTVERMIRSGEIESRVVGKRSRRILNSVILRLMRGDIPERRKPNDEHRRQISFFGGPREGECDG